MSAVATRQAGTEVVATGRNAFEQYAEAQSTNRIVGDLLKFRKGEWSFGQNDDELAPGTQLVANLDELMAGWVKWEGGRPTDMRMGRVVEAFVPARRSELGDADRANWERDDRGEARDPWQLTNYLILKEVDGAGLFTFATSSKGGMGAVGKLCAEYGKRIRQRPDDFPVVALEVESYKHQNKAYGKIAVPVFRVTGWVDKSDFVDALAAENASAEEHAAPPPAAAPRARRM